MKAEWTNRDNFSIETTGKAILIIGKMPDSCFHCRLNQYGHLCSATDRNNNGYANKRPSWCPLKPLPTYNWHEEDKENECEEWYRNGWNACLDEITGGTE